jgi:hypothetical protein
MLPFLSATAMAQPMQLSETQMDTVSAGWGLREVDCSNTSTTFVSVYRGDVPSDGAYIYISSTAISVSSYFKS